MTYEKAQKIEIGDRLIASYNMGKWHKGDNCIVVFTEPDFPKFTVGEVFNKSKNEVQGCNFQSLEYAY